MKAQTETAPLTYSAESLAKIAHKNAGGPELNARTVRYYREFGLIDPPKMGAGEGYSEHHRLQLEAVQILRGRGNDLAAVRRWITGRSDKDLAKIKAMAEIDPPAPPTFIAEGPSQMLAIGSEFLLISRGSRPLTPKQRKAIFAALGVPASES